MKEFAIQIKKVVLIFVSGVVIGLLLLLFAYLIPTDRMIYNAKASIELYEDLGVNPNVVMGYESTTIDTYTDAWMMRIAIYDGGGGETALEKCLNNYFYGYPDGRAENVCEGLIIYLQGEEGYTRLSYARYWHGYQAILKLLLYFFDYGDIMGILKFVQLALVAYCLVLLERNKLSKCIPCMIVMLGCMEFHVLGMSMQLSWVFLVAMVASIYILKKDEDAFRDFSVDLSFLVIGMCTSYVDFLTFPIITLGIPLTFSILRRNMMGQKRRMIGSTLLDTFYWVAGYSSMWASKWVLGTILTSENVIALGMEALADRTGSDVGGVKVGLFDVLKENILVLGKYPYALAVVCSVIILLAGRGKFVALSKEMMVSCMFVVCLPFLWYAISRNHSYIHAFMTYRNLGISVFGGLCFLAYLKQPCGNDVAKRPFCDIIFAKSKGKCEGR